MYRAVTCPQSPSSKSLSTRSVRCVALTCVMALVSVPAVAQDESRAFAGGLFGVSALSADAQAVTTDAEAAVSLYDPKNGLAFAFVPRARRRFDDVDALSGHTRCSRVHTVIVAEQSPAPLVHGPTASQRRARVSFEPGRQPAPEELRDEIDSTPDLRWTRRLPRRRFDVFVLQGLSHDLDDHIRVGEPLKTFFSSALVRRLAQDIARVHPSFPVRAFTKDACHGLDALELLARGRHIADALGAHLPPSYPDAIAVRLRSLGPEHATDELIGVGMAPFLLPAAHAVRGRARARALRSLHAGTVRADEALQRRKQHYDATAAAGAPRGRRCRERPRDSRRFVQRVPSIGARSGRDRL